MSVVEDRRRGRLVDLAALDADQPVLDVIDPPDAVRAAQVVEALDELDRRRAAPRRARPGCRLRTSMTISTGSGASAGATVHSYASAGGVTHGSSSTPVSHDRPHRLTSIEYGDAFVTGISMPRSVGVIDLLVAGQAHPDAHRRDDLEPRIEGVGRDVEADLVVALAGAAVGDRVGALALGDLDEELGDERPGQRRRQRIGALVEGVGLEVRPDEVGDEALARIDDVGPRRAGGHRASLDARAQRAAAEVDRERHDLDAELLLEPGDGDRRIESARVGEDDLVHAGARTSGSVARDRCWTEAFAPALEARLVGEQDEEGIVARQRALLLAEARLVDRLGDDAGRPRRPDEDEDQPAPADRDRDVGRGSAGAARRARGARSRASATSSGDT